MGIKLRSVVLYGGPRTLIAPYRQAHWRLRLRLSILPVTARASAGKSEYAISGQPTDLYIGAWMRYSDPFSFIRTDRRWFFHPRRIMGAVETSRSASATAVLCNAADLLGGGATTTATSQHGTYRPT
jgi:hypothetical protein